MVALRLDRLAAGVTGGQWPRQKCALPSRETRTALAKRSRRVSSAAATGRRFRPRRLGPGRRSTGPGRPAAGGARPAVGRPARPRSSAGPVRRTSRTGPWPSRRVRPTPGAPCAERAGAARTARSSSRRGTPRHRGGGGDQRLRPGAGRRPCLPGRGPDHYTEPLAAFTCAGTPIHDPATGAVAGALSLTTWSLRRHDLLMALAAQTAMNIEARLAGQAGATSVGQLDGYLQAIAERRQLPGRRNGPRLTPLELLEREAMVRALTRYDGRVSAAARSLGLSRATLYRRIPHYPID